MKSYRIYTVTEDQITVAVQTKWYIQEKEELEEK